MKQSKRDTHYEVLVNQVLGITYGFLVVLFIFPLLDSLTQLELASVSSVIFFIGSYARAYGVRRWFEHKRSMFIQDTLNKHDLEEGYKLTNGNINNDPDNAAFH